MMGTGPFAVPTFRGLFETHHTVAALVTGPLRPQRGKRALPISPMRDVAHEHGTAIFDPEDVNTLDSQVHLSKYEADLLVVCDYGQILSSETLAVAHLGGVNLHASLLPKYRGAAPINWALYHGETETGVTVIHMTPKVDAGPCIAQAETPIDPDETAVELEERLSETGAWLFRRAIDSVEAGRLEALPQDPALASQAPRLKKTDGQIDWSRPAVAIKNHIRAMDPWPKTYTFWHRSPVLPYEKGAQDTGAPVRLILGPVSLVKVPNSPSPGTVIDAQEGRLLVAAGEGAVGLRSIQPAGKRMMDVAQFLHGHDIRPGDRLGPE